MRPIAWTQEQTAAHTATAPDARILRPTRTLASATADRQTVRQSNAWSQHVLPCSVVQRGRLRLGLLDGILAPSLDRLQERLARYGSFRIKPTHTDIEPRELLWELGRGQLLVPADPAHPERHRAVHGRLPLLTDPGCAALAVTLGRAAWRAHRDEQFEDLRRLAFWSLELGLVREHGAWRAFGATAAAEPELALPDRGAPQPFDPELVSVTRPTLRHDGALRFDLGDVAITTARVRAWAQARGLLD